MFLLDLIRDIRYMNAAEKIDPPDLTREDHVNKRDPQEEVMLKSLKNNARWGRGQIPFR